MEVCMSDVPIQMAVESVEWMPKNSKFLLPPAAEEAAAAAPPAALARVVRIFLVAR